MKPIQQNYAQYLADPAYVLDVLRSGTEKLRNQAETTAKEVKQKLGLELNIDACQKVKAKA